MANVIEELKALLPPPAEPVGAVGNWEEVEAALGVTLPQDYKDFITAYGAGTISGWLRVWSPFNPVRRTFVESVTKTLERFDDAWTPRDSPLLPLHPEPGGMLPFAGSDNGHHICWVTKGPPEEWGIIVRGNAGEFSSVEWISTSEFLLGLITGDSPFVPYDLPEFDPPHSFESDPPHVLAPLQVAPEPHAPPQPPKIELYEPQTPFVQKLTEIMPQPEEPRSSTGDWTAVEADLGLRLPADYKDFINAYGDTIISEYISIRSPLTDFSRYEMPSLSVQHSEQMQMLRRNCSVAGVEPPYRLYPEEGGLLPIAEVNGVKRRFEICWLTAGDPDCWGLVLMVFVGPRFSEVVPMTFTQLLYEVVTKTSPLFGEWFDKAWFRKGARFRS